MGEIEDKWPEAEAPTAIVPADTVVAPGPPPPVAPPPPGPGLPPDRRIGAGMLVGILVVLLVAAGIVIAYALTHRGHAKPQPTTTAVATRIAVPVLTGQPLADAETNLKQLGLTASVQRVGSTKPAGTVISQVPGQGSQLAKGGVVALTVAKPGATNQTTTTATTTPTTTAAAPAQPQTATMPNVSGQDQSSAAQALGQAGLLPSIAFVPNNDPLGTVESQAKPAGTQLPAKSHVQINVSSGPGTKPQETVPNAIGQTITAAVAAMNAAHLRLIYLRYPVTSQAQAGKIVQQSPLAGGHAPQNAQVLVFLGALSK